jgi:(1->4)-alpha-D-glucan 1-alpha-D-glucosylmutase
MTAFLATYRLQLRPGFGFLQAAAVVPYLADLGISTLYSSPILAARTGSTHGYDVTDPTRLNPEFGSDADFRALCASLHGRGMTLLVDIVPNHMAASHENPWWYDVLARGRASRYARFFDIDWDAGEGKVVLPPLGRPLHEAIAAGELHADTHDGSPALRYFDRVFPLAEGTSPISSLADVLAAQHYTLIHWKEANRHTNYRRFFDIADLVAIRVEDDSVFDATHAFLLSLVRDGFISGLRIDHIDGLRDPRAYLERLAAALRQASPTNPPQIWVEKILSEGESLPESWPVGGTTGYEFANAATRLLVDPDGFFVLEQNARASLELPAWEDTLFRAKREVLHTLFAPDIARTLRPFSRNPDGPLREALIATTAALDVYRTYIEDSPSPADRLHITRAFARAADTLGLDKSFATLRSLMLDHPAGTPAAREFIARWQQLSGPAMAKGCEDTALYRYPVLTALNEVGGTPTLAGDAVTAFHALNARTTSFPLLATSTHDTKRSEDARARLAVLSECPHDWVKFLGRWTITAEPPPGGPTPIAPEHQWPLFQATLAIWPSTRADLALQTRLTDLLIKAARESKRHTSWLDPNADYEHHCRAFVAHLFGDRGQPFRSDLDCLVHRIDIAAAVNSLTQLILKVASPGIPDFYQGCELWMRTLVDPDNRAPVDFDPRQSMLADLSNDTPSLTDLLRSWPDGRLKLFATHRALRWRRAHADTLTGGGYAPLTVHGDHARRVIAFARSHNDSTVIAAAPRLVLSLCHGDSWPLGSRWGNTTIHLPAKTARSWHNALDETTTTAADTGLRVADLFRAFPGALLSPAPHATHQ